MFGYPIHHVGIACADPDQTAEFLKRAYVIASDSGTVVDPLQAASLRIFNEGSAGAIELVSGPAVAALLRRKISYYHICYLTPDLEETIARLQDIGAICVSPPKAAILFGGRRVSFFYTPLGLVEFLEQG